MAHMARFEITPFIKHEVNDVWLALRRQLARTPPQKDGYVVPLQSGYSFGVSLRKASACSIIGSKKACLPIKPWGAF